MTALVGDIGQRSSSCRDAQTNKGNAVCLALLAQSLAADLDLAFFDLQFTATLEALNLATGDPKHAIGIGEHLVIVSRGNDGNAGGQDI